MGQYLQLGICHQILIEKRALAGTSIDQVNREIGKLVDLSLFDTEETEECITLTIKKHLIKEQLHKFLEEQFALYDDDYKEDFSAVLSEIAGKESLEQIVELAKEQEFRFFQHSGVYNYLEISPWKRVRANTSLLVIFVEGKLLMETYDSYLRYLEKLVRASSKQAVAGAFRACIE